MGSIDRPQPGDTILDPNGAPNRILQARHNKLLLVDPYGFQFILGTQRLQQGWQHQPKQQQPSKRHQALRLAEMRYAPRAGRRRIHAKNRQAA